MAESLLDEPGEMAYAGGVYHLALEATSQIGNQIGPN
jgi:hypothetical protein